MTVEDACWPQFSVEEWQRIGGFAGHEMEDCELTLTASAAVLALNDGDATIAFRFSQVVSLSYYSACGNELERTLDDFYGLYVSRSVLPLLSDSDWRFGDNEPKRFLLVHMAENAGAFAYDIHAASVERVGPVPKVETIQ